MMMMDVNIPLDLIEEILSRVPITSLKALKLTCKEWNALSKDPIFKEKHCRKAAKEIVMILVDSFKLRLMNIDLHGIDNHIDLVDPFINHNQFKISQVFHCDGLLLCLYKNKFNNSGLMVWNPYLSQFRRIQTAKPHPFDNDPYIYVMGYDNNNHHKILRFCNWIEPLKYEITRERFERGLPLAYDSSTLRFKGLSVVKEEQLAVLRCDIACETTQIWITTKIEPTAVSWRCLFKVKFPCR